MSDYIILTKEEKDILSTFKYLNINNNYFGINTYDDEFSEFVADVIAQLDGEKWNYGATKFVIIPAQCKYVIKVPFRGEWGYDNETDQSIFNDFVNEDYCCIEADIYDQIANRDISMMFAATSFYATTKSGMPLYIQEKIKETYDDCDHENHRSSRNSFEKAKELVKYSSFPADWIGVAIDYYGEAVVKHFLDYAETELSDMHSANFGYRFDGSPVVHDYSGYYENEW